MSRILIIDDDALILRTVVRMMESVGFDVISTGSGAEGVQLAIQQQPALVICDVMMPGLNGYEVLQQLQQNPETAAIPFIFMTGKGEMEDLRRGMELGADDYIAKPFGRQELVDAVRSRLQKRQRLEKQVDTRIEELCGKIMYVLPHELRTPLTTLSGLAELLASDAATMEPARIQIIAGGLMESSARLERIIENYLVYSQIEILAHDPHHLEALQSERYDFPVELLHELAHLAAAQADRADDLECDLCTSAPVQISEDNLRKLLQELLDNAFKFSGAGNMVVVKVTSAAARLNITIQDHGRGMSHQEIESIGAYNQFQREQFEQPGTGLGLVIAKRMTEVHAGSFDIESEPGKGTIIRLSVPCV